MKFKRSRLAPVIGALRSSTALLKKHNWIQHSKRLGSTFSTTSGELISKARELKINEKLEEALARVKEIQSSIAKVNMLYAPTEKNTERVGKMTSLHGVPYVPTAYLLHPLVHNIFQTNFHDLKHIKYDRELFTLSDGGTVSLDWLAPDDAEDRDIAILIHGLAGGSETPHIRALSEAGVKKGFRTAVFHNRGIGNTKLTTPFPYNGADLSDFETVLEKVRGRYPKARIYSVGTSLGGNILMRYLIKHGVNSLISGGVTLAAPFDIRESVKYIEKTVYEHFLVRKLKSSLLQPNIQILRQLEKTHGIKVDELLKVNTFREFYGGIYTKLLGYDCPYKYVSSSNIDPSTLVKIKKPLLVLHSRDDPIVPVSQVPKDHLTNNPNLIYVETAFGAHHAWLEGVIRPRRWYPKPTYQFLEILKQEDAQRAEAVDA